MAGHQRLRGRSGESSPMPPGVGLHFSALIAVSQVTSQLVHVLPKRAQVTSPLGVGTLEMQTQAAASWLGGLGQLP